MKKLITLLMVVFLLSTQSLTYNVIRADELEDDETTVETLEETLEEPVEEVEEETASEAFEEPEEVEVVPVESLEPEEKFEESDVLEASTFTGKLSISDSLESIDALDTYGYKWDKDTKTLTLDGFDGDYASNSPAIDFRTADNYTIVVQGDNYALSRSNAVISIGAAGTNLTFTGTGNLVLESLAANQGIFRNQIDSTVSTVTFDGPRVVLCSATNNTNGFLASNCSLSVHVKGGSYVEADVKGSAAVNLKELTVDEESTFVASSKINHVLYMVERIVVNNKSSLITSTEDYYSGIYNLTSSSSIDYTVLIDNESTLTTSGPIYLDSTNSSLKVDNNSWLYVNDSGSASINQVANLIVDHESHVTTNNRIDVNQNKAANPIVLIDNASTLSAGKSTTSGGGIEGVRFMTIDNESEVYLTAGTTTKRSMLSSGYVSKGKITLNNGSKLVTEGGMTCLGTASLIPEFEVLNGATWNAHSSDDNSPVLLTDLTVDGEGSKLTAVCETGNPAIYVKSDSEIKITNKAEVYAECTNYNSHVIYEPSGSRFTLENAKLTISSPSSTAGHMATIPNASFKAVRLVEPVDGTYTVNAAGYMYVYNSDSSTAKKISFESTNEVYVSVTEQPEKVISNNVAAPGSLSMNAALYNATGTLSYKWYKTASDGGLEDATVVSSTKTYTLPKTVGVAFYVGVASYTKDGVTYTDKTNTIRVVTAQVGQNAFTGTINITDTSASIDEMETYGYKWDADTKTFTIKDAVMYMDGNIVLPSGSTVEVLGNNTLSTTGAGLFNISKDSSDSTSASVEFKGSGTLNNFESYEFVNTAAKYLTVVFDGVKVNTDARFSFSSDIYLTVTLNNLAEVTIDLAPNVQVFLVTSLTINVNNSKFDIASQERVASTNTFNINVTNGGELNLRAKRSGYTAATYFTTINLDNGSLLVDGYERLTDPSHYTDKINVGANSLLEVNLGTGNDIDNYVTNFNIESTGIARMTEINLSIREKLVVNGGLELTAGAGGSGVIHYTDADISNSNFVIGSSCNVISPAGFMFSGRYFCDETGAAAKVLIIREGSDWTPITAVSKPSGSLDVGKTLTVSTTPSDATAFFRWQVELTEGNWTNIPGANTKSFDFTKLANPTMYVGKNVRVKAVGIGDYGGEVMSETFVLGYDPAKLDIRGFKINDTFLNAVDYAADRTIEKGFSIAENKPGLEITLGYKQESFTIEADNYYKTATVAINGVTGKIATLDAPANGESRNVIITISKDGITNSYFIRVKRAALPESFTLKVGNRNSCAEFGSVLVKYGNPDADISTYASVKVGYGEAEKNVTIPYGSRVLLYADDLVDNYARPYSFDFVEHGESYRNDSEKYEYNLYPMVDDDLTDSTNLLYDFIMDSGNLDVESYNRVGYPQPNLDWYYNIKGDLVFTIEPYTSGGGMPQSYDSGSYYDYRVVINDKEGNPVSGLKIEDLATSVQSTFTYSMKTSNKEFAISGDSFTADDEFEISVEYFSAYGSPSAGWFPSSYMPAEYVKTTVLTKSRGHIEDMVFELDNEVIRDFTDDITVLADSSHLNTFTVYYDDEHFVSQVVVKDVIGDVYDGSDHGIQVYGSGYAQFMVCAYDEGTVYVRLEINVFGETVEKIIRINAVTNNNDFTVQDSVITINPYKENNYIKIITNNADDDVKVYNNLSYDFSGSIASSTFDYWFSLEYVDSHTLRVVPKNAFSDQEINGMLASYSGVKIGQINPDRTITHSSPLTIKIDKTLPSVKAGKATVNSFYTGNSTKIAFTVAGGLGVDKVEVNEAQSGAKGNLVTSGLVTVDSKGNIKPTAAGQGQKASGKVFLNVYPEGYTKPVAVAVSVSLASTSPKLKLNATAITLSASSSNKFCMNLLSNDKKVKLEDMNITKVKVADSADLDAMSAKDRAAYAASVNYEVVSALNDDYSFIIQPTSAVAGKIMLYAYVGDPALNQKIAIPVTVKLASSGTVKLDKTSLKLSQGQYQSLTFVKSQINMDLSASDIMVEVFAASDKAYTTPLSGVVQVNSFDDTANGLAMKFRVGPYADSGSYKIRITSPRFSPLYVTLSVNPQNGPAIKTSTSLVLNVGDIEAAHLDGGRNYGRVPFTISDSSLLADSITSSALYENDGVTKVAGTDGIVKSYKEGYFTFDSHKLYAVDSTKAYKLKINYSCSGFVGATTTISVKFTTAPATAKLSVKGSLDLTKKGSSVTVTPKYTNGIMPFDGGLVVDSNFECIYNADGTYTVSVKEDREVGVGSYTITCAGGSATMKVTASAPKLNAISPITINKVDSHGKTLVKLSYVDPSLYNEIDGVKVVAGTGYTAEYLGNGIVAITAGPSAASTTIKLTIGTAGNAGYVGSYAIKTTVK